MSVWALAKREWEREWSKKGKVGEKFEIRNSKFEARLRSEAAAKKAPR
jgi:hypothetical protein